MDSSCFGTDAVSYTHLDVYKRQPYETLILDIGNGLDEVFQILDMCGRIYMPVLPDKMSCCKLAQFENLLRILEYPQILTKIRRLQLPFHSELEKSDFYVDQLPWSNLGAVSYTHLKRNGSYCTRRRLCSDESYQWCLRNTGCVRSRGGFPGAWKLYG